MDHPFIGRDQEAERLERAATAIEQERSQKSKLS